MSHRISHCTARKCVMSKKNVPGSVKPNSVHRPLLAAAEDIFEADFLAALREAIAEQSSSSVFLSSCILHWYTWPIFYSFLTSSTGSGQVSSRRCTWHRRQRRGPDYVAASTEGQPPLRSRSEPLAVSSLKPSDVEKVVQSHREWETVLWLMQQSMGCRVRKVSVLLVSLKTLEAM